MAKINITRKQLLFWDMQYQQQIKGNFQEILFRTRINEYYHSNGVMVTASKEKREALLLEFIVKEENGTYKTEVIEGTPTLVLKEPIRKLEFEQKMNALMDEAIAIEI